MTPDFTMEFLAEDALLLRFGSTIDPAVNARVHGLAHALREAALPGITDIAPAYASLLLRFDPLTGMAPGALADAAAAIVGRSPSADTGSPAAGSAARLAEIPVCYGGDFGPDLGAVAAHAGLPIEEVIRLHQHPDYRVAMLGFAPGFPYLLGLDPALRMPRRANPRTRVPAGSVAIGGAQTGIYPCELPGGWQLIGRTPLALFDARRDPPCLLAPGDRLRFRAIAPDEFTRLAEGGG